MANDLKIRREKTKARIRGRLSGTPERPRLTVFKSLKRIYVQAIDDSKGTTLAAASSLEKELKGKFKSGKSIDTAKGVGALLAKRAIAKGVTEVCFDRGGRIYHGRIKALADAAREAGLKF